MPDAETSVSPGHTINVARLPKGPPTHGKPLLDEIIASAAKNIPPIIIEEKKTPTHPDKSSGHLSACQASGDMAKRAIHAAQKAKSGISKRRPRGQSNPIMSVSAIRPMASPLVRVLNSSTRGV